MKKFFALVLALVMALSLVACGDKKDDSGDVTAEHTDTTTVAVGAVILARDDVSSDDVYKFVADIFDNAASLTTSHAKYGELSLEYGASITSVPYHPGAAKYFAEKGFEVASVKDGAGNTDSRNLRFVTGGESGTYYAFWLRHRPARHQQRRRQRGRSGGQRLSGQRAGAGGRHR